MGISRYPVRAIPLAARVRHVCGTKGAGMADGDDEQGGEQQGQIIIQPDQMAGVWANFAKVSHSDYEFTLDFVRLDFSNQPPSGIVVARVSVAPLFITQLIDALQLNWQKYAEKALPREVYGDEQGPEPQPEG
jgi:hypothetical protein